MRDNALGVSCEPVQHPRANSTIGLPALRCQENLLVSFTAPLCGVPRIHGHFGLESRAESVPLYLEIIARLEI